MTIRPVTPADASAVGETLYAAFCGIAERHNFPHDFPSAEAATQLAHMCVGHPDVVGFVAQDEDGKFLGSNFLWRQNSICGVGPITVAPDGQGQGVGRGLMQAVLDAGKNAPGIRLVQDAFNTTSLSLYASLGFEVVEPLVLMHGVPSGENSASPDIEIRPWEDEDYDGCNALCEKVLGFERGAELRQTATMFPSFVALRENEIVAYASAPNFWQLNYAVAQSTRDMEYLLAGAARATGQPLSFLLPTRQAELFRWCLQQKLRVVKPLNLMATGKYQEPRGAFLPSVLY